MPVGAPGDPAKASPGQEGWLQPVPLHTPADAVLFQKGWLPCSSLLEVCTTDWAAGLRQQWQEGGWALRRVPARCGLIYCIKARVRAADCMPAAQLAGALRLLEQRVHTRAELEGCHGIFIQGVIPSNSITARVPNAGKMEGPAAAPPPSHPHLAAPCCHCQVLPSRTRCAPPPQLKHPGILWPATAAATTPTACPTPASR